MVLNHQRRIRVSVRELERFQARVCRRLRIRGSTVSVCLVTNARMALWNRAYRGKHGPTDVLSFPTDGLGRAPIKPPTDRGKEKRLLQGTPSPYLGDIAIAPAVAKRNARHAGRTFGDEMRMLMLHGVLHLLGYDHETDSGDMERCELRLRRELGLA